MLYCPIVTIWQWVQPIRNTDLTCSANVSVIYCTKKGFGVFPKPFNMLFKNYFLGVGAGVVGKANGACAGAAVGLDAFLICSINCGSSVFCWPPLTVTFITSDNTIIVIAKTQVPFSRKSPVFYTPINCDEPEKFDDKPPPLGFWISTISPKRTHAIIKMIIITKYIFFYINWFSFLTVRSGLQSKAFFPGISIAIFYK